MANTGAQIGKSASPNKLRWGYTTGACAAAASRAATELLITGEISDEVTITLPCGDITSFKLHNSELTQINGQPEATCSILKDAGDDPDCTHGAEIVSTVTLHNSSDIIIDGGIGVARVTKPGLELAVGEAAINPVPQRNIREMVLQTLGSSDKNGATIIISVPEGEERAKQTINARLGLLGGISILGTRGTVRPYSTSAFAVSVRKQIHIVRANNIHELVLTTGSRTERFGMLHFPELSDISFVQAGDFVGVGLRAALSNDITKINIVAMIGKLAKLCAGHMMTHVSGHAIDFNLLAEVATTHGANEQQLNSIKNANTGRHVLDLLKGNISPSYWDALCKLAAKNAYNFARKKLPVTVYLVDFDGTLLGRATIN